MNRACEEMDVQLARWADRSLPEAERERVAAHLALCATCRTTAMGARAVHDLLRSRADSLQESAPSHLREWIVREARRGSGDKRRPPAAGGRRWWQMPVAAGIVLALVAGGLVATLAPSGTVLAAELAFDHVKCRALADDQPGLTPQGVEQRWRTARGWTIEVPETDRVAGLELTGLRRCLFHGGDMAHVLYEFNGRPVSLFVLGDPGLSTAPLEIMGLGTTTWTAHGHTYALTGDLSEAELTALAARMRESLATGR